MPRYIDADALLNKVERYFGGLPIVVHHDMVEYIENAPTADVRENVHAHWVDEWHIVFHAYLPKCSSCGNYSPLRYGFCPKCGAEIDEVTE